MRIPSLASVLRRLRREALQAQIEWPFRSLRGVIHVGANDGEERQVYARHKLNVLWIEPLADAFARLTENIRPYPRQRAIQSLLAEHAGETVEFNVSNENGVASSILPMAECSDIWPLIVYQGKLRLTTSTLDAVMKTVDPQLYDGIVLDTQGSELLVLKGGTQTLKNIRFIRTEVGDFNAYADCPRPADFSRFLSQFGFQERRRRTLAEHPNGGRYYDIDFVRR